MANFFWNKKFTNNQKLQFRGLILFLSLRAQQKTSFLCRSYVPLIFITLFIIISMQGLAAHLKRRNFKLSEKQTSLPQISTQANTKTEASEGLACCRPILRYISEITYNPEEEIVRNANKIVLQKEVQLDSLRKVDRPSKNVRQASEEEPLPNFRAKLERGSNDNRIKSKSVHYRKKIKCNQQAPNSKGSIDFILKNKGEFIRQYFKEIHQQATR